MPVREIPRSFEYTCDGCSATHLQQNATGHYTDSRPPGWTTLMLKRAATDFQGAEVADASITRLLCPNCTMRVAKAINEVIVVRPAPKGS